MRRSDGTFRKSLVRAYHRHLHGSDVLVTEHQRADKHAITAMLAKRHHHLEAQHQNMGPAGSPPSGAVAHAAAELPAAKPNPAESGGKKKKPTAAEKAAHREAAAAHHQQRRASLTDDHNTLARARSAERTAATSSDLKVAAAYKVRAQELRASLQARHGAAYENRIEGELLKNYSREIEQDALDWTQRLGYEAHRDDAGRPEGIFGLLNAEAQTAAWMALQRRTSANKQSVREHLRSAVTRHLNRSWRDALGAGATSVGVRENHDLQAIAKFQGAHMREHGEMADDDLVAKATGMTPERVSFLRRMHADLMTASLQAKNAEGGTLEDLLEAQSASPEDLAVSQDTLRAIHEGLKGLDSPIKRALVLLDAGMSLDTGTLNDIIKAERLPELADANHQALSELGQDAPHAEVAAAAVAKLEWPAGTKLDQKRRAARQLLEHGNSPDRLLMDEHHRPHEGVPGDPTPAELYRRLGRDPKDASQTLRTALNQLRKQPAIIALGDAMEKSLDVHAPTGWMRLLRNLALAEAPEPFAKSAPLEALWHSLTDTDPLTGTRTVRSDRQAEATILRAAIGEGSDAPVYRDSPWRALHERYKARRAN